MPLRAGCPRCGLEKCGADFEGHLEREGNALGLGKPGICIYPGCSSTAIRGKIFCGKAAQEIIPYHELVDPLPREAQAKRECLLHSAMFSLENGYVEVAKKFFAEEEKLSEMYKNRISK